MLPVEVRILPTYEAVANVALPLQWLADLAGIEVTLDWNMMNSYGGLILPLIASATATFLFRQFFLTVPDELCEAARIDGCSPLRFFRSILLPLSLPNMVALAIILFLYGWNQYLWPLLFTTDRSMATAVIGLKNLIPQSDSEPAWNVAMNAALLVMLPPVLVVMLLQRWLVKGWSMPGNNVAIIGHRGARNLWPENSLDGFRRTRALGIEGVEFDVHIARDGELVVIHDPTLERTTEGTGRVADPHRGRAGVDQDCATATARACRRWTRCWTSSPAAPSSCISKSRPTPMAGAIPAWSSGWST
jgi:ABC-type molybdate transport system permease subunit